MITSDINTTSLFITCVMFHFLGDYITQNDWMALNKKNHTFHCLIHTMVYLLPFFLINGLSLIAVLLIGVQHFIQDRTNLVVWFMNIKGSDKFVKPPCGPWSIIITDNVIHVWWIFLIVKYLN